MATKQSIAIIGASGETGSALAKGLAKQNYRLLLMAADAGKLNEITGAINKEYPGTEIEAIPCSREACWEADIILLAVPYYEEKEVAEKIKEVATGKTVISITNRQGDSTKGTAGELKRSLPFSKLVKAFYFIDEYDTGRAPANGKMAEVVITGDDEESLLTAAKILAAAGFHPGIHTGITTLPVYNNSI